jgi:thiol-disulfide isomerase/thioredoxin
MPGVIVSAVALALSAAFGFYWRSRDGRMLASRPDSGPDGATWTAAAPAAVTEADLGASLGSRATLLQFSSAFCAPCRAIQQVLADVAATTDGVTHVEVDAGSRLDLVRRLDVRRTPTTFVLNPDGQVTHRASGQPSKADVIAALGSVG